MIVYELVIFDLDGTLMDTSEGIISSIRYTVSQMGFECPDDDTLKTFIGPPIQYTFEKYYDVHDDVLNKMSLIFREHYKDMDLLKAKPYDGIYECLRALNDSGVTCAVATNKREDYALKLLNEFGFDRYMKVMHGSDFNGILSKSDIIRLCIDESGIDDKSKILMVGDAAGDLKGANDAGVDFLPVTYGFGEFEKEDLKKYGTACSCGEIVRAVCE